jgi:type II secretory ATPase GspE/PulE/Tfp pilus assembly ATPase PilB-like protein
VRRDAATACGIVPSTVPDPTQPPPPGADRDAFEARPRYRTLFGALRDLVEGSASLHALLAQSGDLVHALLDAERVNLFVTDPCNTLLWTLARSDGGASQRLPRSFASIPGFVAITRRAVMVRNAFDPAELTALHPDLRHDPARDPDPRSRTRQVLAVPLISNVGVVGVLEFVNSLDGMDFRADDLQLAEAIAALLAPRIEAHLGDAVRARPERARFGLLVALGLLSDADLDAALGTAKARDLDPCAVLVDAYRVPRDAVGRCLADWHHLPFFAYDGRFRIPRSLVERFGVAFLRAQGCAPLAQLPDGTLLLAADAPDRPALTDALAQRRVAPRVSLVVGIRREIVACLDASLAQPAPVGVLALPPLLTAAPGPEEAAASEARRDAGGPDAEAVQQLLEDLGARASLVPDPPAVDPFTRDTQGAEDAAISRLVRHMILDAAARGASDIHIEPNGDAGPCRVRLRIDGDCVDYITVPAAHRQALVQRIKLLGEVDIAERRRPQDGRIRVSHNGVTVEVRLASLPTVGDNEDLVLRLLSAWRPMPLETLEFRPRNLVAFRDMIAQPFGIVIVVGPTGSGKTTTLHAALGALNTPDMKILTVEDPVEIVQPGLRQVQVNARIGLGFAEVLRSFLRADPDVIMVGEMRDRETATVGIEASLTGHLVLSTLQSNSAPETLTRLFGMDVDTLSLADALRGVLAQRLVRRLCTHCRAPYAPTPEEWHRVGDLYGDEAFAAMMSARDHAPEAFRAVGCTRCRGSGYRGRLALHELLPGTPRIQQLIRTRAHLDTIRAAAAEEGMKTMLQDGIEKVFEGLTDFRQVRAACVV